MLLNDVCGAAKKKPKNEELSEIFILGKNSRMQNADQSAKCEFASRRGLAVARSVASRPREVQLSASDTGRILIHALFMPRRVNEIAEVDLHERSGTAAGDPVKFGNVEDQEEERDRERERDR